MNNQKAIEILNNYHNGYFGYKIDDVREAHQMAIKALKLYPFMLQAADRDKDMIKAMAFIKEYCKDVDGCSNCPMFDNCTLVDNKKFPIFWYIPEV